MSALAALNPIIHVGGISRNYRNMPFLADIQLSDVKIMRLDPRQGDP
jgi:hypothetical protein